MKKRILTALPILTIALVLVFAIRRVNPVQASFTIPDPCYTRQRVSAPVNVSTATTTSVVAAVPGAGIYVCGQFLNVSTLSATIKWEYGTQVSTPCDTGTVALTGAIATPAASPSLPYINAISDFIELAVPAGNQLCIVTTGTTPGVQGFISYVQG